jgi:hypothetical protein
MRYNFTRIANAVYETTVIPDFISRDTDYYIISREGDRLDSLSQQFYERPDYWWIIAQANGIGKGSLAIAPGMQIRIPFPINDWVTELQEAQEMR